MNLLKASKRLRELHSFPFAVVNSLSASNGLVLVVILLLLKVSGAVVVTEGCCRPLVAIRSNGSEVTPSNFSSSPA